MIKKDKFVEGYLGLKFLQDSGKETGDKKNAYEVKKNRFLKLIESQYAFQKLYLDNLKKEGDSKHGNVEIQTERLNSLAVFIEYIEQMKNMPKDKSEEALSKRNALLKKIAKEQLKENLGKTDLLESFDKETVQEIRIDMVDFFSKDQSFIEYYDVEDKEEMEENEEMKDEFEIEKVSPKDKFPNLFRLFKKYFDRQNITKILAGEKELKDIEKELKIFFENSQSGPTEYKKLSLF